ncbi:M16 family metallopeptidase [Inquilinus sp.]|jgi:zinc protease|uniref:M16 family metallopeptidase n=1 Tax=Inquilinus sp. TaxID=1932117 RepID=UPI0037830186
MKPIFAHPLRAALAGIGFLLAAAAPAAATTIDKVVSPGGIEAWLVEDHTVPVITLSFAMAGGSAQDPDDKLGLASLLSDMLTEGAGAYDAAGLKAVLADRSIQLGFGSSQDYFTGRVKTLSTERDAAFELLRLTLAEPRLDPADLDRVKAGRLADLNFQENDPGTIADDRWSAAAFPGHPYGRPTIGTKATVAAIGPDDLRGAQRRLIARDGLRLAVVGDIDAATLGPALDRIFGDLPAAGDLRAVPEIKMVAAGQTAAAMPVSQAVIQLGYAAPRRDDPDYFPSIVMNHILGGSTFTSRLYTAVREQRGLAYSVDSNLIQLRHSGVLVITAGTQAARAGESLKVIRDEIARLAKDGPTAQEVTEAKSYLIGSYPLGFASFDALASYVLQLQLAGRGRDFIELYPGLIEAVTADQVKAAAAKILEVKDPTAIVVGGPAS